MTIEILSEAEKLNKNIELSDPENYLAFLSKKYHMGHVYQNFLKQRGGVKQEFDSNLLQLVEQLNLKDDVEGDWSTPNEDL